jgi:hypothetical protein
MGFAKSSWHHANTTRPLAYLIVGRNRNAIGVGCSTGSASPNYSSSSIAKLYHRLLWSLKVWGGDAMTDDEKVFSVAEQLHIYQDGVAKALETVERHNRQGFIGTIVTVTGAAFVALSVPVFQHFFVTRNTSAPDLPARISTLTTSLKGAAETIGAIEQEIKQRQVLVEQLEREADTASKLKTLNKEQLDAVAQVLKGEIQGDQRRNFWSAQGLAFFYAAVGVALSELYRFILRWRARRRLAAVK